MPTNTALQQTKSNLFVCVHAQGLIVRCASAIFDLASRAASKIMCIRNPSIDAMLDSDRLVKSDSRLRESNFQN